MIADLKPYPKYKESGIPWLGQVPAHWDLIPNRGLIRKRKVLVGEQHSEYKLLSLTKQGVIVRDISTGKGKFSSDMGTSQEVREGDLVFCLFDVPETPRTVGLSRYEGMITGAYSVFESTGRGDIRYFESFYLAMDDRKLLSPLYSGLRNTIPTERLMGTKTPQPPENEQAAIVQFLGWANGRLERTIRAKRKVIALLNEQKQAIIHRAVTRGLDPSCSVKPTCGRWFTELPDRWRALSLRRVIVSAVDGPHFSPQYRDSGIPFLSARNVKAHRWSLDDVKFINEADYKDFSRRVCPQIGDVLYTKGGTTGVARAVDLAFPFQVWVHIAVLRLNKPLVAPEFLAYCLNSPKCYEQSQLFTRGATNQDLGLGRMKDIEIPLPPTLDEQNGIVELLNTRLAKFNKTITRLEREIQLLREYRACLVADVVTGKLDVRGIGLPESSDDPWSLPIDVVDTDGTEDALETDELTPSEIEA